MDARTTLLSIPTPQGYTFVKQEQIVYCESDGNYSIIFLQEGKQITCSRKLKQLEPHLLKRYFIRVHQSYIINLLYVRNYFRRQGGQLELANGVVIQVARSRKKEVMERFGLM